MIRACTGERKLAGMLKAMQDEGGHYVMLTLLPTGVPPHEKLADIADLVLTDFKSIASTPPMSASGPTAEQHHCREKVSSQKQSGSCAGRWLTQTSRLRHLNATIQRARSDKIVG
jgi:hypothetical protein